MTVAYDSGEGRVTHTVFKSSGPSIVDVLTRLSNTAVTVALPFTQAFALTVKYNGKSVGTTYVFSALWHGTQLYPVETPGP